MKRFLISGFAAFLFAGVASAVAPSASGFLTWDFNGTNYDYDIHLTNTGTTGIQTLWYAWIPGESYLPSTPVSTSAPAGWTQNLITHSATDGFGIRWQTTTSPLAAGSTLSGFKFTSTADPLTLAGNSLFHANPPVGTTFVFTGTSISLPDSFKFVINPSPVPEPATIAGLALGIPVLLRRRKKNR